MERSFPIHVIAFPDVTKLENLQGMQKLREGTIHLEYSIDDTKLIKMLWPFWVLPVYLCCPFTPVLYGTLCRIVGIYPLKFWTEWSYACTVRKDCVGREEILGPFSFWITTWWACRKDGKFDSLWNPHFIYLVLVVHFFYPSLDNIHISWFTWCHTFCKFSVLKWCILLGPSETNCFFGTLSARIGCPPQFNLVCMEFDIFCYLCVTGCNCVSKFGSPKFFPSYICFTCGKQKLTCLCCFFITSLDSVLFWQLVGSREEQFSMEQCLFSLLMLLRACMVSK